MELHPAIYSDRRRQRDDGADDADGDALAELDDVDLKELLLDDDILLGRAGAAASAAAASAAAASGSRAGASAAAGSAGGRRDGGGAGPGGGGGGGGRTLASISAPINALRNFFFPGPASAGEVVPTPELSFSPFAFTGEPDVDGDAQPGRKRMAVDRDGRRSPVFTGFSSDDAMPYPSRLFGGSATSSVPAAAVDGWAASLPPLLPPPPRYGESSGGAGGGRGTGPRASDGGSSSSAALLASNSTVPAFAPENLVKSELLDTASTPEDLLRALNQTFIQTSENASRRRLELRRSMARSERPDEPPLEGGEHQYETVKRRENHASVERRRRDNINECIAEFARMVPDLQESSKLNKGLILRKAVEYLEQVLASNSDLDEQLRHAEEQWRACYRRAELMTAQADAALQRVRELSAQNEAYLQWARANGASPPPPGLAAAVADVHQGPLALVAVPIEPHLGGGPAASPSALHHADLMLAHLSGGPGTATPGGGPSRSRGDAHSPGMELRGSAADAMDGLDAAFYADDPLEWPR